jgi:hypothetical protein
LQGRSIAYAVSVPPVVRHRENVVEVALSNVGILPFILIFKPFPG